MDKWVLSIVSTVLISSIIALLLPEGKMAKYVKFVFGILIILVIIQPVLDLKNNNYDFNFDYDETQIVFQDNYLNFVAEEKIKSLKENIKYVLEQKGFKEVEINIEYTADNLNQVVIQNVRLDLKNSVYIYDSRHIDIIEDIVKPVCKCLNIDEKQVNVIE